MLEFGPPIQKHFPLPATPHRPGQNARPVDDLTAPVRASIDIPVTEDSWPRHDAYLYGFVLYRAGYFWEAHEVWEPVWMQCTPNSIERLLLQAVIQLANAALKGSQGNPKASARLYRIALDLIREVISRGKGAGTSRIVLGVDADALEHSLTKIAL